MNFKQYAKDADQFVKELAGELGYPEDRNRALRVFKSVLHALRDMIPVQESVELLAQLPMFMKAVYVDGWSLNPGHLRPRTIDQLVAYVQHLNGKAAKHDFGSDEEVERAIAVTFYVLRKYVSLGELEDIRSVLPKEIKPLLNQVLMV